MPRAQISIKLEQENLERVDAAAEELGISRTELIERAVVKALNDHEALVDEMSNESAIVRKLVDTMAGNKQVMLGLAKVLAPHMDRETVERAVENQPKYRAAANRKRGKRNE